jgi:hypothetical protein
MAEQADHPRRLLGQNGGEAVSTTNEDPTREPSATGATPRVDDQDLELLEDFHAVYAEMVSRGRDLTTANELLREALRNVEHSAKHEAGAKSRALLSRITTHLNRMMK